MKRLFITLLAVTLAPVSQVQAAENTSGAGEFPGLQILPPGSVIEDIVLPRYKEHRVSALLKAGKLKVASRSVIELHNVAATMYSDNGDRTTIETGGVIYDFRTKRAHTTDEGVSLNDPRFTAKGKRVVFDSGIQRGILLGPVRTTVTQAAFNKESKVSDKK